MSLKKQVKKQAKKTQPSEKVQIRAEDKEKFDDLLRRMIEHKPVPKSEVKVRRKPKARTILGPAK